MGMEHFTIGILAKRMGIDPPTIRYYEKEGLLSKPARTAGGYRLYTHEDQATLEFIKSAQGLGLSLKEIKKVLEARAIKGKACDHVVALLQAKIAEFDVKVRDLKRISRLFTQLLRRWEQNKKSRKTCICDDLAQTHWSRKSK